MENRSYIDAFDAEGRSEKLCRKCGICLQRCPVMQMGKQESRDEHARLRSGEETRRVLRECTFCYNCNDYCPHHLNPLALIMERVAEGIRRSGKGIPAYLQYLFTGQGDSSVFADVYKTLPKVENAVLDRWETAPAASAEVLFIGCIGREIPYGIEHSSVLETLPKYGPRNACCGELPFRLGDFETFAETAKRASRLFEGLSTKRLVCYCGSCSHSLRNIWREYLGIKLPFEVTSIWEWLWEKVQDRELEVRRTIDRTVVLTDSCYGSQLGDGFLEAVRGLHEIAGMNVVELKNNRQDNLCCGAVSIVRNDFDLSQPLKVAEAKIEQVKETQITDLSCYCPGCFIQLGRAAKNIGVETHYCLEEILWAFGDDHHTPLRKRTAVQGRFFLDKLQAYLAGPDPAGR